MLILKIIKNFFLFWFLIITPLVFGAIPVQGAKLHGAGAADARLRLLASAESCLGVPYRYAGLNRSGLDCSGLVYLSFREGLNYISPRSTDSLYTWTERIETRELQPGDLVFFITTGPGISHVGIYAGDGRFIHSASEGPRTGVIYSHLEEAYWKRCYAGAGRALPWDDEAAAAMASARNSPEGSGQSPAARSSPDFQVSYTDRGAAPAWTDSGIFTGFGTAFSYGGFIEGSPSIFRGISTQASIGYKWTTYRVGLELRPEWDRALGVWRLPLTVAVGTDIFQVFLGPALTFGDPGLSLSNEERYYKGGGYWLGEAGFSAAFPPIRISTGALSVFGELAWQPYLREDGEDFKFKPDFTANYRLSTGIRYFWLLGYH